MQEIPVLTRDKKPLIRHAKIEITVLDPARGTTFKSRTVLIDRDEDAASILAAVIRELTK